MPIIYGEKHGAGFQYYTERRPAVEVSDTIYFDWGATVQPSVSKINTYISVSITVPAFFPILCSNHAWLSFWVCTSDIFFILMQQSFMGVIPEIC